MRPVLVVGAGGFIGHALATAFRQQRPELPLRLLARRPVSMGSGSPSQRPDPCEFIGDVANLDLLARALDGVGTAYYLVHGLANRTTADRDPEQAERLARVAARAGVQHLVCVGALGCADGRATPHVSSRRAVAEALRTHGDRVSELRTAVVVGRGSAVVELFRRMVERLGVLVVPQGADARVQPVALADLVQALVSAHDHPVGIREVGGPDVLTWRAFLNLTATLLGTPRPSIRMPVATPRLSGLFMSLFGPFTPTMGESFVRGLGHDAVVGPGGLTLPTPLRTALAAALDRRA